MMEEAMLVKPFAFKRRFERVDWRKLASINLDQIARDLDFNALQENLTNIAFCNIELELDLRLIDPNFVKLFRLGQLTIEYLLEYLSENIVSLEGRVKEQNKNEENLTEKLRLVEKDLDKIKKEGHKRKKLIADQQHLIEAGAENFHKCLVCPKAFMNATFLQNHCMRRHGQTFQEIKSTHEETEKEIPSKISEQLQEIKDRLIFTESQLTEERRSMKELGSKEASLLAERDAEHLKRLEEWQETRESEHKQQIERIQNMLMTELREMQEKQLATQKALEAAQLGLALGGRPSNLGSAIRDDLDVEREMLQREREQVMKLKDEIKVQIGDMQDVIQHEVATREKDMRRNRSMERQEELDKFHQALQVKEEEITALRNENCKEVKDREKKRKQPPGRPASPQVRKRQESPPTIVNGHTAAEEGSDKKRKTLTFADEREPIISSREEKGIISEVRELSRSDTLSSQSNVESDEETLATATNQSLSPTATLDLTGNSRQLRDVILQNPRLLQDMKTQLQQKFNDELSRWDVQPDSQGLSASKLATKQKLLAQERNKMERKYKTFRETREALIKNVDSLSKDAMATQQTSNAKGGLSPKDSKRLTGTMSSMTATMESSTWGTTSSKWSSSDRKEQLPDLSTDEDSDSEEEIPPHKTPAPAKVYTAATANRPPPPVQQKEGSTSEQTRASSGWTTIEHDTDDGGFAPPHNKPAIQMPGVDAEEGSEWDEDDLSELADIGDGRKTTPVQTSTSKARGVVGNIAANIESQLLGRKGKAPAGGINTLEIPSERRREIASPSTPDIAKMEASDDDFSISSVEVNPQASNTYSSRQWGQGTASTARPGGGERANSITSDNASLTSVTGTAQKGDSGSDWSADSDFMNL